MKAKYLILIILIGITFSSTYFPLEDAKFIVRLEDAFGNPITNASCYAKIYFPNNSIFIEGYMTLNEETNNFELYYTIPEVYGTYTRIAYCEANINGRIFKRTASDTFFVSNLREKLDEYIENITKNATLEIVLNITGNISQSLEGIAQEFRQGIEDLLYLVIALHSTPETYKYCKDNETLIIVKQAEWNVNNRTFNITKTEQVKCEYGCNPERNECNPSPWNKYFMIGAILFVILILFLILRAYL